MLIRIRHHHQPQKVQKEKDAQRRFLKNVLMGSVICLISQVMCIALCVSIKILLNQIIFYILHFHVVTGLAAPPPSPALPTQF